jgi:hypothetical protein
VRSQENESRNRFRKVLAEAKLLAKSADNTSSVKVAVQEKTIAAAAPVKKSRGFEMG